MKDNELEVGDEIYSLGGFSGDSYHVYGKIDRVTKTMAFIGGRKFKRETHGSIYPIPRETGWNRTDYKLLINEVRKDIKKQIIRYGIESVLLNWGDGNLSRAVRELSDDKLSRIADILGEEAGTRKTEYIVQSRPAGSDFDFCDKPGENYITKVGANCSMELLICSDIHDHGEYRVVRRETREVVEVG